MVCPKWPEFVVDRTDGTTENWLHSEQEERQREIALVERVSVGLAGQWAFHYVNKGLSDYPQA